MTQTHRTQYALNGGVSQQPNAARLSSQCERQDDAYSSLLQGLGKRPPTEHVANLGNKIAGSTVSLHWIMHDGDDQYLVVFDRGLPDKIAIFDLSDGTQMRVSGENGSVIPSSIINYLQGNKHGDIRCIQVFGNSIPNTKGGWYTMILNRDFTVRMLPDKYDTVDVQGKGGDWRSKSARRAFYFIRKTAALKDYSLRLTTTTEAGVVDPPQSTQAQIDNSTTTVRTHDGTFSTPTKYGTPQHEPPYNPSGSDARGKQIPSLKTEVVARQFFNDGPEIYTATGNDYEGGLYYVYDRYKSLTENLADLLTGVDVSTNGMLAQSGSVVMLELKITDKADAKFRASISLEAEGDSEGDDALVVFSGTIQNFSDLPLHCQDGHVVRVSGDPEARADDYHVEFVVDSRKDPYDMGRGHWIETTASGEAYLLDRTTLPLWLLRVDDPDAPKGHRFELRHLAWTQRQVGDDTTNPAPLFVDRKIRDMFIYEQRLGFVGDQFIALSEADTFNNFWRTTVLQTLDSDPIMVRPGEAENDILNYGVPYAGRLLVFGEEQVYAVEGEPLLTPNTVSITPVLRIATYGQEPWALWRPIKVGDRVFTAGKSEDEAFTAVSEIGVDGDRNIRAADITVQVPRYIQGRPYAMAGSSQQSVLCVVASSVDLIRKNELNALYVYKWNDVGNERRLSSWFRFLLGPGEDIGGSVVNYNSPIQGMSFDGNVLYLLMRRFRSGMSSDQAYTLEKMDLTETRVDRFPWRVDPKDQGTFEADYLTLLDRRTDDNACTITWDQDDKTLDIQLPYMLETDTTQSTNLTAVTVITRRGNGNEPEGHVYQVKSITHTGTTPNDVSILHIYDPDQTLWAALGSPTTANQNRKLRNARLFIGVDFEMNYQFSPFALRERNDEGQSGETMAGRTQVLYMEVGYRDTGAFSVEVAPKNGQRLSHKSVLGALQLGMSDGKLARANLRDGQLRVPVYSMPQHVDVSVRSRSPFPCRLVGATHVARFVSRTRPWRG